MTLHEHNDGLPQVTDDDFFAMLFQSDAQRWKEIAEHQPDLAREIEQRANRFRLELEAKSVSPLEAQQEIIDFGTFLISAMTHAIAVNKQSHTPQANQEPQPPVSA